MSSSSQEPHYARPSRLAPPPAAHVSATEREVRRRRIMERARRGRSAERVRTAADDKPAAAAAGEGPDGGAPPDPRAGVTPKVGGSEPSGSDIVQFFEVGVGQNRRN